MFTGIIQHVATIVRMTPQSGVVRLRIRKPTGFPMRLGQSVALDGICTTAVETGRNFFDVELMPETLRKTIARTYQVGDRIHLEKALTLQNFIDGHLLQGHIDARGEVLSIKKEGTSALVSIRVLKKLQRFIATHGAVAVNGVSLTVARKRGTVFQVGLIPYTLAHTTFGSLHNGDFVNIEIDLLARYVENLSKKKRVS